MYTHDFQKRIRYGETDQMGYLYYGNYALLYEIGRSEAIRNLGISYQQMESEHRIMMPVLEVQSRYMKPLRYDERVTIRTLLPEMPTKLIQFHHEIYNDDMILCHRAQVKLCFIDMRTNKMISTPSILTDLLVTYYS